MEVAHRSEGHRRGCLRLWLSRHASECQEKLSVEGAQVKHWSRGGWPLYLLLGMVE
jgi:hypothetical protein